MPTEKSPPSVRPGYLKIPRGKKKILNHLLCLYNAECNEWKTKKKNNNNNTIGKNTLHNYCIIVTIYTSTKQHLETWKRLLCDEIISGRRACGNLSAGHETEKKKIYIFLYKFKKKKKWNILGEKKMMDWRGNLDDRKYTHAKHGNKKRNKKKN